MLIKFYMAQLIKPDSVHTEVPLNIVTTLNLNKIGDIQMTEQIDMTPPPPPPVDEVTSDDRLWSALAYVFSPLVSIILLLMEDKKARPFVRYHAYQSLVLGIAVWILVVILSFIPVIGCITPFLWILMLYFAYKAYQGEYFTVPVITEFVKKQGWV
jgi:uncharacterized membrane protein